MALVGWIRRTSSLRLWAAQLRTAVPCQGQAAKKKDKGSMHPDEIARKAEESTRGARRRNLLALAGEEMMKTHLGESYKPKMQFPYEDTFVPETPPEWDEDAYQDFRKRFATYEEEQRKRRTEQEQAILEAQQTAKEAIPDPWRAAAERAPKPHLMPPTNMWTMTPAVPGHLAWIVEQREKEEDELKKKMKKQERYWEEAE